MSDASACIVRASWTVGNEAAPSVELALPACMSSTSAALSSVVAAQLRAGSCPATQAFFQGPMELAPPTRTCTATISYDPAAPAAAVLSYSSPYCGATGLLALSALLAAILSQR